MKMKVKFGPRAGGSYLARAKDRWGKAMPDWIAALAKAADSAASLTDLGKRLNYSPTTISTVISNSYPGRLDTIEALVRGAFMAARVECPLLGEIGRDQCAVNQKLPFSTCNPIRAQLYSACRSGCLNAIGGKDHA